MIGKRKRETTVSSRKKATEPAPESETGDKSNHHDLFRQYFEARFKPIEQRVDIREAEVGVEEGVDSPSESEWDGISDEEEEEEEEEPVEVVAYDASQRREEDELARAEFKSFMTSKPPTNQPPTTSSRTSRSTTTTTTEPATATDSLKNDLSLQRLLQESHLLTPDTSNTLTPTGQNRHKATDLRIQSLSANSNSAASIFTQEKMPLAHRRGIEGKKGEREERRRREARENGVVLEREKREKKKKDRKRERGVGGPGVGSFRGGMLRLSRRDVEEIEGPKRKGKQKGRGRGGKR